MSNVPVGLRYAKSHEWLKLESDGAATIGIPDAGWKPHGRQHMQLGDVLMVPWRSAHGGLRWLSLAIVGACMLGAVAAEAPWLAAGGDARFMSEVALRLQD